MTSDAGKLLRERESMVHEYNCNGECALAYSGKVGHCDDLRKRVSAAAKLAALEGALDPEIPSQNIPFEKHANIQAYQQGFVDGVNAYEQRIEAMRDEARREALGEE